MLLRSAEDVVEVVTLRHATARSWRRRKRVALYDYDLGVELPQRRRSSDARDACTQHDGG